MVRAHLPLKGAEVSAGDLRGGAALVIAALAAEGRSIVHGLDHIARGYERLIDRLRRLGARSSLASHDAVGPLTPAA